MGSYSSSVLPFSLEMAKVWRKSDDDEVDGNKGFLGDWHIGNSGSKTDGK